MNAQGILNKEYKSGVLVIMTFIFAQAFAQVPINKTIRDFRIEYQEKPLGIDSKNPRFSWKMEVTLKEREIYQTAYQIIVKDEQDNILWNSQKFEASFRIDGEVAEIGCPETSKKENISYKIENGVTKVPL